MGLKNKKPRRSTMVNTEKLTAVYFLEGFSKTSIILSIIKKAVSDIVVFFLKRNFGLTVIAQKCINKLQKGIIKKKSHSSTGISKIFIPKQ